MSFLVLWCFHYKPIAGSHSGAGSGVYITCKRNVSNLIWHWVGLPRGHHTGVATLTH